MGQGERYGDRKRYRSQGKKDAAGNIQEKHGIVLSILFLFPVF